MNEALSNIMTRRSVKAYKPDMVPHDVIERIVTAGTYAASGMNKQASIIWQLRTKKLETSFLS